MPNIPKISEKHVLKAFRTIDRAPIPRGRGITKYALVFRGRRYPPKLVITRAVEAKIGRPFPASAFYGGLETNAVLRSLGFQVVASADSRSTLVTKDSATRRPIVARLIVDGRPSGDVRGVRQMLSQALKLARDTDVKAQFLVGPGGFVQKTLDDPWTGSASWQTARKELPKLSALAEEAIRDAIGGQLLDSVAACTDFFTLGVDLQFPDDLHAELVGVWDCRRREFVGWTGKSYPVSSQERTLIQVSDLRSHLMTLARSRVLVLGCHDLNMFSPRGAANQIPGTVRHVRCRSFQALVDSFRPAVVLHHPHRTDSPNIWRNSWGRLLSGLTDVKAWASGIGYDTFEGEPRGSLSEVMVATKASLHVADLVVRAV